MADLAGLVRDPEFVSLPLSQQKMALAHVTGDQDFASLSDADAQTFLNRARNSTPTQFEQERNSGDNRGAWAAIKQDLPHPVGSISETEGDPRTPLSVKAAATSEKGQQQYEAEQQARKASGYGLAYRTIAPVGQYGLGVNAPGMEMAAAHGDTGAIYGHAAIPAAAAVAPLALEGTLRGASAAINSGRDVVNNLHPAITETAKVAATDAASRVPVAGRLVRRPSLLDYWGA
jgi:hypothetical protein